MHEPWPSARHDALVLNDQGRLEPTAEWWRGLLARPELAPVPESCKAERALHRSLVEAPSRPVGDDELRHIADPDARENYALFLRFRDRVLDAATLEAAYVGLFRGAGVDIPPLFVDLLAQCLLRRLLHDSDDALEWRAAQMLFRAQRCARVEDRLLAGDQERLDLLNETGGFGDLGRLMAQSGVQRRSAQLEVLSGDNAAAYFAQAEQHGFLLDLTLEIERDLGHGLGIRLSNARSGVKALARVLERWVAHLLGTPVRIQPLPRIDDEQWRWHVGLDAVATSLLNDLYEGREIASERLEGLAGLFRLDFESAAAVRPEMAGRPVYLAMAMDAQGTMRLKPQNLLLNLPLAHRS